MNNRVAILLVGVVTCTSAQITSATESMAQKKPAMTKAAMAEAMVQPHYRATGKPISASFGAQVFVDHCAICHGLHGKGDGPRSAFFQPGVQYIPDLTNADFLKGRDEQLLASIREGQRRLPEPAYVMPQFKYILSDQEIRSVFSYIKTLPAQGMQKR